MSNNLIYSRDTADPMKAYILLLVLLMALAGCSDTGKTIDVTRINLTDSPKTVNVAIEINGFEINPGDITVGYGDTVNLLVLNNKNSTVFRIEDYVEDSIARNNEYHTTFKAMKKGKFTIYVDGNERGQMVVN